ncbi:hypothetical protein COP2_007741 [Malus domestica]
MFATATTQPLHRHCIFATLHRRHCTATVLPAVAKEEVIFATWALPTRPPSAATRPSKSTSMKGLAKLLPFTVESEIVSSNLSSCELSDVVLQLTQPLGSQLFQVLQLQKLSYLPVASNKLALPIGVYMK